MVKYLIIANAGEINIDQIERWTNDRKSIALDGIANHLFKINFIPDFIIGDFDSISLMAIDYYADKTQLIKVEDQNTNDLDKAIHFADVNDAEDVLIINAMGGGRTDHAMMNVRSLRKHYSVKRNITILNEEELIIMVKDAKVEINAKVGDNIAILSFPKAVVTSQGLAYEMKDYLLEFGLTESSSNKISKELVIVEIKGEALIIYPFKAKILISCLL